MKRNLIKVVKMKPYFAALMLSVSVLPAYAGPLGTADKADLPQSNVSSPMIGPVAQATRPATDIDGQEDRMFSPLHTRSQTGSELRS
nr:hypothetical protein [uncultured bacterium]